MTAAAGRRAALMGDPRYFSIRGGANPHTRDRWGRRKSVDRGRAIAQWHGLARTLTDLGAEVYVVPAREAQPGLVYPANAGVALADPRRGEATEAFLLANLLPTRAGERPVYEAFLAGLGLRCASIARRFEGEADFFPARDRWVFTYGAVLRQRFAPRWGLPPWRRVYGFRSDRDAAGELAAFAGGREILPLELCDEAHYHGDTVLCSFGPRREFLLAWLEGLAPESARRLRRAFGEAILPLGEADARRYAANSFGLRVATAGGWEDALLMPDGLSDALYRGVEALGVRPIPVEVGEFLAKGGGSVKCMIGDLGFLPAADLSSPAARFRRENCYRAFLEREHVRAA